MIEALWSRRFGLYLFAIAACSAGTALFSFGQHSNQVPETAEDGTKADSHERSDGLPILKALVDDNKGRLQLSTDKTSATDQFFIILRVQPPGEKRVERSVNTWIARDGDQVGLIVTSRRDDVFVPCCFVANGIAVGLDPSKPGGLLVADHAQPGVIFAAQKNGSIAFLQGLNFGPDTRASILLDPETILTAGIPKLRDAEYNKKDNSVLAHTEHSTLLVQLASRTDELAIPLRRLTLVNETTDASLFVLPQRKPDKYDLSKLTLDAVRSLKRPIRSMTPEDGVIYFTRALPEFHDNLEHRTAARQVMDLIAKPTKDQSLNSRSRGGQAVAPDR